jgi:hypothetical protein
VDKAMAMVHAQCVLPAGTTSSADKASDRGDSTSDVTTAAIRAPDELPPNTAGDSRTVESCE